VAIKAIAGDFSFESADHHLQPEKGKVTICGMGLYSYLACTLEVMS